jgi:hypothetical protein
MVSGSISLPSRGAFHHFPHGTRSLSVAISSLALEGGPPRFRQGFSCLAVLRYSLRLVSLSHTGLSPSSVGFPNTVPLEKQVLCREPYNPKKAEASLVWALPRSLAATEGISFDFSSFGYLDGSVPRVLLPAAMYSLQDDWYSNQPDYSIRISPDRRMFAPPRGFSQLTTSFIAG